MYKRPVLFMLVVKKQTTNCMFCYDFVIFCVYIMYTIIYYETFYLC